MLRSVILGLGKVQVPLESMAIMKLLSLFWRRSLCASTTPCYLSFMYPYKSPSILTCVIHVCVSQIVLCVYANFFLFLVVAVPYHPAVLLISLAHNSFCLLLQQFRHLPTLVSNSAAPTKYLTSLDVWWMAEGWQMTNYLWSYK